MRRFKIWYPTADVVLAVGTEFGETDIYYALKLPLRGPLIRIDIDPRKLADHYAAEVPVWGEARAQLQGSPAQRRRAAAGAAPAATLPALRSRIESSATMPKPARSAMHSKPSARRCRATAPCSPT